MLDNLVTKSTEAAFSKNFISLNRLLKNWRNYKNYFSWAFFFPEFKLKALFIMRDEY